MLDEDDIAVSRESDSGESTNLEAIQTVATLRKRAATLSSPKQRKHKQTKIALLVVSDTGSQSGDSSRRSSRPPAPTLKVRENLQHEANEEESIDGNEEEPDEPDRQQQATLSQFSQTEAVVRRLGTLAVSRKAKKAKKAKK